MVRWFGSQLTDELFSNWDNAGFNDKQKTEKASTILEGVVGRKFTFINGLKTE
jgi:hypothetical protein